MLVECNQLSWVIGIIEFSCPTSLLSARLSYIEQVFGSIGKVYATGGEPCCAECVTPVFNDAWSPRASIKNHPPRFPLPTHQEETETVVEVSAADSVSAASCCV